MVWGAMRVLLIAAPAAAAAAAPALAPAPALTFDTDVVIRQGQSPGDVPAELRYHLSASEGEGVVGIAYPADAALQRRQPSARLYCTGGGAREVVMNDAMPAQAPLPPPPALDCGGPRPTAPGISCGTAGVVNSTGCRDRSCCWDAYNNWCWGNGAGPACAETDIDVICNPTRNGHDPAAELGCFKCMLYAVIPNQQTVPVGATILPNPTGANFSRSELWEGQQVDVYRRITRTRNATKQSGWWRISDINATAEYGFRAGTTQLVVYRANTSSSVSFAPAGFPLPNYTGWSWEERGFHNYSTAPPSWRFTPPRGVSCPFSPSASPPRPVR